jgi:hypothetical protein
MGMSGPARQTDKTLNWPSYNKALKRRNSLTIRCDAEVTRPVP